MTILLALPEKVSTNAVYSGMHWSKRKDLADLYHLSLYPHRKVQTKEYPVEITYRFRFKGRALDTTNCTFMAKLIEDGLVANAIIKNDDPEHVYASHIYSTKGRKDEVEITILAKGA